MMSSIYTLDYVAGSPQASRVCTESPTGKTCVAYACEGDIRNNSIVLIVGGFGGVSYSYFFYYHEMQSVTRTCAYDPRGTGWSSYVGPFDYGFVADAADVDAVLSKEMEIAAIPKRDAVAILVAHSRGTLVATKFKAQHDASSETPDDWGRIVIISLDGSTCNGQGVDTSYTQDLNDESGGVLSLPSGAIIYGLVPIIEFVSGFMLTAILANPDFMLAGMEVDDVPEGVKQLIPLTREENHLGNGRPGMGFVHRTLVSKYWIANAEIWHAWWREYDGPTLEECKRVLESDYLYVQAISVCVQADGVTIPETPRDLWFCDCNDDGEDCVSDPNGCDVCFWLNTPGKWCAKHVPLAQMGSFASAASARAKCYLNSTLGWGVCPSARAANEIDFFGRITLPERRIECAERKPMRKVVVNTRRPMLARDATIRHGMISDVNHA
eukprot:CAMPEP_0115853880 /NCGR_PEP_ID=MMETSP0287-20121206/13731_1 /TAXON_ID=412157 /ORGANISM="Chrysochromulina rotalis, Strain UIO044" /LENGTH=438 /DNA_ID=CAMNT_0003307969 /DNA_START=679 /DNA_END=1995 /DNA_ORIENTATION=-